MSRKTEVDWVGLAVRFTCGAILGALVGLRMAASDGSKGAVLGCVAGGAALVGTASAVFGDAFWETLFWRR